VIQYPFAIRPSDVVAGNSMTESPASALKKTPTGHANVVGAVTLLRATARYREPTSPTS
jgi:hypothetical protein